MRHRRARLGGECDNGRLRSRHGVQDKVTDSPQNQTDPPRQKSEQADDVLDGAGFLAAGHDGLELWACSGCVMAIPLIWNTFMGDKAARRSVM